MDLGRPWPPLLLPVVVRTLMVSFPSRSAVPNRQRDSVPSAILAMLLKARALSTQVFCALRYKLYCEGYTSYFLYPLHFLSPEISAVLQRLLGSVSRCTWWPFMHTTVLLMSSVWGVRLIMAFLKGTGNFYPP